VHKWLHILRPIRGCALIADKTHFVNDEKHPLNERINIQVGSDSFLVGHPAVVQPAESAVHFNHDVFQGVLPTSTGAKALIIEMSHEEKTEGPVAFTFIENKWKTGEKVSYTCKDLKYAKP
jgi:hypothetical protein